jgi:hypothetical protein
LKIRGKLNLWSATLLGRGKNRSIHRAIFSLALLCLAGCDLYNQSIEDFIYYQTGTVLPRDKASVISPAAEPCPDGSFHIRSVFADIVLELDLENDRGYDLRLRALNNGTESGGVRAEQIAPDRVLIRIAGAKPEDVFRIVLQVGSADGYRSFGEIPLPVIYCHAPLSGARELLSFAFGSWPGTIDESAKTVDVTVSPGTVISGITPAVTVSPGADYSPKEPWGSGVSGSFKTYTVTAEDGTSADYVVTVTIAAAPVYSIVVTPSANGTVTAPAAAAMTGETITLTVNPAPGYSLKPGTLLVNGDAGGISGSGGSYSFVMPGMDVQITAEFVSSAKELLSFDFGSWPGTVNESAKTVNVTVPYGTAISGITPAVTVSAGADYSPKELWGSGVSGGYKNYTVIAEDGTSADYVVTVTIASAPVYTIVVIPSANGTVTASAAAAMAGETITLTVNPAPGYSLKPGTLLANGDAGGVSGSGGSYSFVMPAADVTVTAAFEAMPGQGSISVTFSGVPQDENTDLTGTTGGVLNWAAGNLTLTAPATGVFAGAAYQWYLDGKELAGKTSGSYSAAGSDFTLARHQVTAIITTSTGIVYAKAVVFVVE